MSRGLPPVSVPTRRTPGGPRTPPMETPTGCRTPGRCNSRQSLATEAFMQAQHNKEFLDHQLGVLGSLSQDNQGLEDFVGDQQDFTSGFVDFRIANFADMLRPGTQRAVSRFLGAVGRRPILSPENPPVDPHSFSGSEATDRSLKARLGPSAILEHAQRGKPDRLSTLGSNYMMRWGADGNPRRRPLCERAARVRKLRQKIAEASQSPDGTAEEAAELAGRALRADPESSSLPALSAQSPQRKYGQASTMPARNALDTARFRRQQKPADLATTQQENVTVVTGEVDYTALLAQQQEMNEALSARDVMYEKMVETYDTIQAYVHRRLSLVLKQDKMLGPAVPRGDTPHIAPLRTHTTLSRRGRDRSEADQTLPPLRTVPSATHVGESRRESVASTSAYAPAEQGVSPGLPLLGESPSVPSLPPPAGPLGLSSL